MRPITLIGHMFISTLLLACSSATYKKTVAKVERDRFMGSWYVMAGRFTVFEKDAFNAIEKYQWNQKEQRIDIKFEFNKGSLDGPKKKIPQKGWIVDQETNATWAIQPIWPLKFGYLIIALDTNYEWTAIGVPDEDYLWIMARDPSMSREKIDEIIELVRREGYNTEKIVYVEHSKP